MLLLLPFYSNLLLILYAYLKREDEEICKNRSRSSLQYKKQNKKHKKYFLLFYIKIGFNNFRHVQKKMFF